MDDAAIERESMEFDVVIVGADPSADQRRRAVALDPKGACSGMNRLLSVVRSMTDKIIELSRAARP